MPGGKKELSTVLAQKNSAAFLTLEVLILKHAVVDQRDAEPVRHGRAQFFHQIQRQRGTAGPITVHETHVGVQAYAFQRRSAVVGKQHISKGKQCVHVVGGRTAVPTIKEKIRFLVENHFVKNVEVPDGSLPLQAAQGVQVCLRFNGRQQTGQRLRSAFQFS